MSERVRMARALDAVEKVVNNCCDMAAEHMMKASHMQNEMAYDVLGAVADAAERYGVDQDELAREAMRMLHDELMNTLWPICNVRYVKPYKRDGMTVGMMAKTYKAWR